MNCNQFCSLFLVACLFSGESGQDVQGQSVRQVNVGFFLSENDTLTELALQSALNIITHNAQHSKSSSKFYVKPILHRVNEQDLPSLRDTVCRMVEKGVAAIFGPEHPAANDLVQSLALNLKIPQFQTVWNPNLELFALKAQGYHSQSTQMAYSFDLYPNPRTVSKALATLVRDNDWRTLTVIYEHDDGLVRLQEIIKAQNPKDPPITYKKLGSGPDHRSDLKEIRKSAIHIVLDCETDHIINILQQAKEIKMLEEYHAYLLTSLDAHTIDFSVLGEIKANISFLSMIDYDVVEAVVSHWELVGINQQRQIPPRSVPLKTALLYDAVNLFYTAFSEIVERRTRNILKVVPLSCDKKDTSIHGDTFSSYILAANVSKGHLKGPLTGFIGFDEFGQRSTFRLKIIELLKKDFRHRVTNIWDSQYPSRIYSILSVGVREQERVQQLTSKPLRVASRIGAPYLTRRVSPDGKPLRGNDRFEGYVMDLMLGICKLLNCTFNFEIVPDNNYGSYDPVKKEWNGLIRYILDRNADLAICDLTTTSERRKVVDFTNPFMTLGISVLYSKVIKEPPELLSFTNPLSLDVWLYMGTAYILITMIIFLVARINPHEWESAQPFDENPEELENIWNLRNGFWLTLGSIMAQGCDILPKGISTRMVTSMWWFFSLIMTASYTANMAAFLTNERMGLTIKTAEDLAGQGKIKYGCLAGGATASFFKESNDSTYHKMWVQMESADPTVFEKSNTDGVKRVLSSKGKYAFLMESSTIEYEMARHCDLTQVGGWLDTKGYGIAMPTDAPLRTDFNHALLTMQESGTLQSLKKLWWHGKNNGTKCGVDKQSEEGSAAELGLPHVGGVFVVLAAGILISLVVAVFEFLWNVRKVAIVHHITLKEAFIKEYRFAINLSVRRKAIEIPSSTEATGKND